MDSFFVMFLFIFGIMGFSANMFARAIWMYCDWREGQIDWKRHALLAFLVPGAYLLVMVELMAALGFFVVF